MTRTEQIRERLEKATHGGSWDKTSSQIVRAIRGDLAIPLFHAVAPYAAFPGRMTARKIGKAHAEEWRNADFIAHCGGDKGDVAYLLARVDRLKEALEWYGENARLCRLVHSGGDEGRQALSNDGGQRARAVLEDK